MQTFLNITKSLEKIVIQVWLCFAFFQSLVNLCSYILIGVSSAAEWMKKTYEDHQSLFVRRFGYTLCLFLLSSIKLEQIPFLFPFQIHLALEKSKFTVHASSIMIISFIFSIAYTILVDKSLGTLSGIVHSDTCFRIQKSLFQAPFTPKQCLNILHILMD